MHSHPPPIKKHEQAKIVSASYFIRDLHGEGIHLRTATLRSPKEGLLSSPAPLAFGTHSQFNGILLLSACSPPQVWYTAAASHPKGRHGPQTSFLTSSPGIHWQHPFGHPERRPWKHSTVPKPNLPFRYAF